jgi:hypothetical protein
MSATELSTSVELGASGDRARRAVAHANTNDLLDAALWLAGHGIPVFPCHPGTDPTDPDDPKSKKPLTKHGFKDASTDERQILRWWTRWPNALVGVPTGSPSGLLVIDIDPDGIDFLLAHEELGIGRRHNTRRGFHFLFRAPDDVRIRCSAGKLSDGVDVRGESGYIIWWPATGQEASGPDIETLPPVPAWLLELLSKEESRTAPQLSSPPSASTTTPDGFRRIEEALTKRNADCGYDEWVRVGMSLHHESGGSEEGFCVWDTWSKRGRKKYRGTHDLRTHWNSFSSEPGKNVVTAGSILRDDAATADDFASHEPQTGGRRFRTMPDHQFVERAPLLWHVKGVLPKAELVVAYGPSGSGKSFFAFDMVAAIATGTRWHGRKTTKARVVYIVAEGAAGFLNRLKAYVNTHAGSFPGLNIIADAPNLLGEQDSAALAKEIEASGGADLIVIDTLAACSPGADENAAKDMGKVIDHCKQLHKATRATVLLIHHSGKDESKGARGWSGLRAAADAEIEVSRNADHRIATVTKMKDGEDGAKFAFKLVPIEIGVDADGEPVTSCVVEPLLVVPRSTCRDPQPGTLQRLLLNLIRDDLSADGQVSAIEAAAMRVLPKPSGRDTRKQSITRALLTLVSKGLITMEADSCRVS